MGSHLPAAGESYAARKAAARRELAFNKRLALIATFFHAATQVTYLKGVQPFSSVWCQRVGSVLFVGSTWAWPAFAPISALRCGPEGGRGAGWDFLAG
jgi:hypothetical protein